MTEYRWLSDDEILAGVNPVCTERGWAPLNVNPVQPTCRVLGAFEESTLVGWIVIQLHPVIGPEWVDPDHQDGRVSRELVRRLHEFLDEAKVRGALTICDSPATERLAKRHGMSRIEVPVYLWLGGG